MSAKRVGRVERLPGWRVPQVVITARCGHRFAASTAVVRVASDDLCTSFSRILDHHEQQCMPKRRAEAELDVARSLPRL